jgi:hypothetical protein
MIEGDYLQAAFLFVIFLLRGWIHCATPPYMNINQLKASFTVYASRSYNKVDKAVDALKAHGFDAVLSSEANKPYAIKIETTVDRMMNAMDCVKEVLKTM